MAIDPLAPRSPHFPGKAKSVIYLHMAGAPSQLELFDFKPALQKLHDKPCPPSLMEGKRFAFIRGTPKMLDHKLYLSSVEIQERGSPTTFLTWLRLQTRSHF